MDYTDPRIRALIASELLRKSGRFQKGTVRASIRHLNRADVDSYEWCVGVEDVLLDELELEIAFDIEAWANCGLEHPDGLDYLQDGLLQHFDARKEDGLSPRKR